MASNVTKKVNVSANQRFDKADFDSWQDYFEAAIARLGAIVGAPLIDTNDWLVDGTLEASTITPSGADLTISAGCEFMLPSGHIVALEDDYTFTGVLPLATSSSLMVKVSAADVADAGSTDNRRFWSSGISAETLLPTETIKQKELQWAIINTASLYTYIGSGWTRAATLTTAGVGTWKYFFPSSGALNSIMGIMRRLLGSGNTNSGDGSISLGGFNNTNSGSNSASSGGEVNTNSGSYSASSGGYHNTNSGSYSASSGGDHNTNSGSYSASSGGIFNTNSGSNSASSGGKHIVNNGENSVVAGGQYFELQDDNTLALGYDTTLTPSGSNQNLSHYFNAETGEVRHLGDFKIGGDVNDGTGYTAKTVAANGDIRTEGYIRVGGDASDDTSHKMHVVNTTGAIRTVGNVRVGGTIASDSDQKVKLDGSTGNVNLTGDINLCANTETLATKKMVASANGNFAHLGKMRQKYESLTGTVATTAGTWVEDQVTLSGSWTADLPIYKVRITIDNSAHPNLDAGDSVYFLSPSSNIVGIVVKFISTTTTDGAKTRWAGMLKEIGGNEQVVIYNAGGSMGDIGTGEIVIDVTMHCSEGILSL